ncbi:MAG: copper amine oxidase N-terminal domain-containing protein [Firmicutes bacterium]|nr:copper amine oxidase N-terminal domain-containing protein [Bacillota bacterium]
MNKLNNIKWFTLGIAIGILVTTLIVLAVAANTQKQATLTYRDIKIILDGVTITPKDVNGNVIEPFIIDGTTYLPIRGISSALGIDVEWVGTTSTVTLTSPDSATLATFEKISWQVGSIASNDYGIKYSTDEMNFKQYPLDKLIAYCLNSDGAYSEGSFDELYQRFLEAPNTVLAYIALVGDSITRDGIPAKIALCKIIVSEDVFFYDITKSFKTILEKLTETYPSGSVADILSCMNEEYKLAIERAK